ncbi:MAG: Flagellar protein [Firmicutes bacterium]|nr:Flagellar protein [Bacillota bacterium]
MVPPESQVIWRFEVIKLTKFKNSDHDFVVNADLIETIEETPDTVITLTSGKKLIVSESMDEVVRRVMEYRRALYRNLR